MQEEFGDIFSIDWLKSRASMHVRALRDKLRRKLVKSETYLRPPSINGDEWKELIADAREFKEVHAPRTLSLIHI